MIYLDYAATNPFTKYPCIKYGQFLNPNANYAYKEQKLLDECVNRVKTAIGAKSGKVIFGGTSSQLIENLMTAITYERSRYEIVCSYYEHNSFYKYRDRGVFNFSDVKFELDTADDDVKSIVIWQAVQNITGEIFPAKQIGELVHKYNGFYICDGTAQVGHASIEPNIDDWCDFYVFSGHKLGTELSIGCCWVSDRLDKWLGDFKLHGTPNLAGAMAIADATEDACKTSTNNYSNYVGLYIYLVNKLIITDMEFKVIGTNKRTGAINAIMFDDINADSLQQYLESKQIYVGIGGSACASLHDFRVLNACGLSNDEASCVVRVSFGEQTTYEDIDEFVNAVVEYKEKFVR